MASHRRGSWTACLASTDAAAAGAASIYYGLSPGTSPSPYHPRAAPPPPLPASAETNPEPRGEPAGRRSQPTQVPRPAPIQRQYGIKYNGPKYGGASLRTAAGLRRRRPRQACPARG